MNRPINGKRGNSIPFFLMIEVVLFLGLIIFTCCHVHLNGDDYRYACYAQEGIISPNVEYYLTGNGRFFTNILNSTVLLFDRYLYIVIAPLLALSYVILLKENIVRTFLRTISKEERADYFFYAIALFSCIGIMCFREVLFWITGMMNYLFGSVLFLAGILAFRIIMTDRPENKLKKAILYLFCLLPALAMEQYGLMYVGYIVVVTGIDFFKRKTVRKDTLVILILSVLLLLSVVLAPGNFVKVKDESSINVPLQFNITTLLYNDALSDVAFPFILMLSLSLLFISIKGQDRARTMVHVLLSSTLFVIKCIEDYVENELLLSVAVIIILVIQIVYCVYRSKSQVKDSLIALTLVGIGSQLMLLASVIWGYRCMFSLYTVYMLLIMYLFTLIDKEHIHIVLLCGLVSSIAVLITPVVPVVALIIRSRKYELNVYRTVLIMLIAFAMGSHAIGYYKNEEAYVRTIISAQNASDTNDVRVYMVSDSVYTWEHYPLRYYHEHFFREYYGVSDSSNIEYVSLSASDNA